MTSVTAAPASPLAFSIQEAVRVTGLSRSGLYRHFQAGDLTPRKAGGRSVILADDLHRFLATLPLAPIRVVRRAA